MDEDLNKLHYLRCKLISEIKEELGEANKTILAQAKEIEEKNDLLNKFYENRYEADKLTIYAGRLKNTVKDFGEEK